jgi:hypothetical protein
MRIYSNNTSVCIRIASISDLVVTVPGYKPRGLGFDSRRYQIFCVPMGLERGPLSPCEDK